MECKKCPAFLFMPTGLETGQCHGCRSGAGSLRLPFGFVGQP